MSLGDVPDRFSIIKMGEGSVTRTGACIVCASCGVNNTIMQKSGHHWSLDSLEVLWRRKGWTVGSSKRRDMCPECSGRHRAANSVLRQRRAGETSMAGPTPAPPVTHINAPREMSRQDRRIIFAKLEEVYENEETGYRGDWTDDRVSVDLGVPRAWITQVREENFGPAGDNAEIRRLIGEARRTQEQVTALRAKVEEIRRQLSSISAEEAKLASAAERLSVAALRIERGLGR